jgi:hypothetical protein
MNAILDEVFFLPESQEYTPPLSIEEARFPAIIDNSQISDFRKCEQKWFNKYCRKLLLKDESVHLVAGGAYAKGLEVTRRLYWDEKVPFREALRQGMRAAMIRYGTFDPHGKHWGKNVWRVLGAIEWHFQKWPIDGTLRPFKPGDKHAIEFSFGEPLPANNPDTGDPLIYAGKCDQIVENLELGLLGPEDDKTTTQLGEFWQNQWDLSGQMFGYVWAAKRTYPEHADLIRIAFIRGVSILKTKYGEADAYTYADQWQLDAWYNSLLKTIQRMLLAYARFKAGDPHPFEKSFGGACSEFGGCAFKVLCNSPNPEAFVPVHFTVNTWNPLESRD